MINRLSNSRYIKLFSDGIPPEQLITSTVAKIGELETERLRPLARILEDGSDDNLKGLLMDGLEDEEGNPLPVRRWSPFMYTDPVALKAGKVVTGKGEFAAEYASMVFLFESDENLKKFVGTPRAFLQQKPVMPKTYSIALCGPHASGKKEMSARLAKRYGWKVINLENIVEEVVRKQMEWQEHIPCNPETGIHLSEEEFKLFMKGGGFPMKDAWPIVANQFGIPLRKRPEKVEKKEGDEPSGDEDDKKK